MFFLITCINKLFIKFYQLGHNWTYKITSRENLKSSSNDKGIKIRNESKKINFINILKELEYPNNSKQKVFSLISILYYTRCLHLYRFYIDNIHIDRILVHKKVR